MLGFFELAAHQSLNDGLQNLAGHDVENLRLYLLDNLGHDSIHQLRAGLRRNLEGFDGLMNREFRDRSVRRLPFSDRRGQCGFTRKH